MNNKKTVLDVNILGKEYKIGCLPELQNSLQKSAQYLDHKMREVRDLHQVVGLDKIAVLAALHITHELLTKSPSSNFGSAQVNEMEDRIKELNEKVMASIDSTLLSETL